MSQPSEEDAAETAWNVFRAAYGNCDKEGAVKSGLLTWSMLSPAYRAAFVVGVSAALVQSGKGE